MLVDLEGKVLDTLIKRGEEMFVDEYDSHRLSFVQYLCLFFKGDLPLNVKLAADFTQFLGHYVHGSSPIVNPFPQYNVSRLSR